MSRRQRPRRPVRHQHVPVLPGVAPDDDPATITEAMRQAHEDLPHVPGTRVVVRHFPLEEGLSVLRDLGYSDRDIDLVLAHPDAERPTARLVVATRETRWSTR